MNNWLTQLMFFIFGRRVAYRIGRALYRHARGDVNNDMLLNGEMLVQRCVVEAWQKGDSSGQRLVIFDVGANVGDWSFALLNLLAKLKSEDVDIYVFEPVSSTFEFLKGRLGTQNPILHYEQIALSAESGEGKIYVSNQSSGINSLHANPLRGDEEQVAIVRATVTDFCKTHKIQKVHLLKCDTEGHDMEVIRGSLPLLAADKISVLQFEYNHRWVFSRNYLRDAFMAIEKLPYKLAMLQPDHIVIFSEWHPELEKFFESNYAIVHIDALDWFPTKRVTWDIYNTMYIEGQ